MEPAKIGYSRNEVNNVQRALNVTCLLERGITPQMEVREILENFSALIAPDHLGAVRKEVRRAVLYAFNLPNSADDLAVRVELDKLQHLYLAASVNPTHFMGTKSTLFLFCFAFKHFVEEAIVPPTMLEKIPASLV